MSLWEAMFVAHHKLLRASAKTSCNMRPERWDLNINHINVTRPQHNHIFCLRSQHKTLSRYWIRRNLTLLAAQYLCCLGYANFPLRILIRAERRRVGKNSNEKNSLTKGSSQQQSSIWSSWHENEYNWWPRTLAQMTQGTECQEQLGLPN